MSRRPVVTMVVPEGVDDPLHPSGGNTYDRRLGDALRAAGWSVVVREVGGRWPWPAASGRAALDAALHSVPDRGPVVLDGLVASSAPDVVVPACGRLHVVVLLHMPLGLDADRPPTTEERSVLAAAASVVVPSEWLRGWLVRSYGLRPGRVRVVAPGADPALHADGTAGGGNLLCVAAVSAHKGHDVLVDALTRISDLPWRCVCAGSLTADPGFVVRLGQQVRGVGLHERLQLAGPLAPDALDAAYRQADVVVVPSRAETYGLVVTEALARGVPVIASDVGGVPEALGWTSRRARPGLLVPPGDVEALAGALQSWLVRPALRRTLRERARERAQTLPRWSATADGVARLLAEVAA